MATNVSNENNKILYKDLSYKLQGLFFDIRNDLGSGHKESIIILFVAIGTLFVGIRGVSAATLFLDLPTEKLYTGDSFKVDVRMESNDVAVNAVQARIDFPPEMLEVVSLSKVNSVLVYWPEEPTFDNAMGEMSFIGGLPTPGFQNVDGLVGTVVLRAKKDGDASLGFAVDKSLALINDGRGSKAELNFVAGKLAILDPPESYVPKFIVPIVDDIPPEAFTPRIGRSDKIFENRYFVAFQTQDRESGISHYEIMEIKNKQAGPWKGAKSPHALENQKGRVRVLVKAVDLVGNETIGEAEINIGLGVNYWLVLIAVMVGVGVIIYLVVKKIIRKRRESSIISQ